MNSPTAGVNELQFIVVDVVGVFTARTPPSLRLAVKITRRRLKFYCTSVSEAPNAPITNHTGDTESGNKRKLSLVSWITTYTPLTISSRPSAAKIVQIVTLSVFNKRRLASVCPLVKIFK